MSISISKNIFSTNIYIITNKNCSCGLYLKKNENVVQTLINYNLIKNKHFLSIFSHNFQKNDNYRLQRENNKRKQE